ncbi:hypothetical protein IQ268_23385 [Oculatella sp. LEGE 06141]|uniref:hypothetical protein n=1 Tax=Oculatella sp. LEGE 06141 TaxID=1828648 RepID=UPI001881CEDA|nr:hypothetical protein [Oculatella sp. LEGE 06141]MBE9181509.1 hypothetical protein [Oculatella sp. LEGE 06141]
MGVRFQRLNRWSSLLLGLVAIASTPALAQTANFDSLSLSPGFTSNEGTVSGYTQGSFSLTAISDRDNTGSLCLGYAASTPDHVMTLEQDFSRLRVEVNSGGNDTTLIIVGPNNRTVRCGDDTGSNKDASIEDTNWRAGTYRIWVGSFDAGSRYNYTLSVEE